MLVDGSLAASSSVTVDAGAKLGGTGTVNGSVVVDGTITGGGIGTVGTLTTGSATWNGNYQVDLASATSGDLIQMSGLDAVGSSFKLMISGAPTGLVAGNIYSWTIAKVKTGTSIASSPR